MKSKWPLVALAGAQFIMVLDQSVMNVSISALVEDFHTTVTTIQAVITLYCLVMAMFMLTGGKIGDIIGRRRAFVIGLVIYAFGSGLTAVSQTVWQLTLGWSILEGIGAALVLPAMAALIAGNFEGKARKGAYAIIGGVAGAGIAIGPILGGWATTELSWRVVFVGEVVIVIGILAMTRFVADALRTGPKPRLDVVGSILAATALGAIVLGILQSTTWGLIAPKDSPVTPFGLSLAPFVIALGGILLWGFVAWQRHREASGKDPLGPSRPHEDPDAAIRAHRPLLAEPDPDGCLLHHPALPAARAGHGRPRDGHQDAADVRRHVHRGSRRARDWRRASPSVGITRAGLAISALAAVALLATMIPTWGNSPSPSRWASSAWGWACIASQLGLVVQSSVDASGRGEAGGLQYTGQQLGSSLGVALIGAIVLAGLAGSFVSKVEADPRISAEVAAQVGTAVESGGDFVASSDVEAAAVAAGVDEATTAAIVDDYEEAQLLALKAGLLVAALIALASLASTKDLPHTASSAEEDPTESVAA